MAKNYFTDEQLNAIHEEICRLEDLDSGISMQFQPLNNIGAANLRRICNLAVETAIGEPVGNVFINNNVVGIAFNSPLKQLENNQLLYSVKELDN